MSDAPLSRVPPTLRGYRIEELLGEGSMGAVYRASVRSGRRGLKRGEKVALKVLGGDFALDPNVVRRFKREAGVGLGAVHPGLARVFDLGSVDVGDHKIHFIVQELLTGQSLKQILEEAGRLSEPLVRSSGRQIAEALAFVHRKGIVHRDLKPANVFLEADGRVKLVDFGLARLTLGDPSDSSILFRSPPRPLPAPSKTPYSLKVTSAGQFLGTVAYAAPEQLDGRPATPASDLFCLGLVLFEMASGSHPFAGELLQGFDEYVYALKYREAPPLTSLRQGASYFLERLIQALLQQDPRKRLRSAEQVAETLLVGESSPWWRTATSEGSDVISRSRRRLRVRRRTRVLHREKELRLLKELSRRVLSGGFGASVWIEGEAGAGKTRLLDELANWVEETGRKALQFVLRCAEVELPSPFFPLRELVSDAIGIGAHTEVAVQEVGRRLDRYFEGARRQRDELARHLARTGALDQTSSEPLVEAYTTLLTSVASQTPTVLIIESVHAADAETLAVIRRLVEALDQLPLLLLITARPEELDASHPLADPLRELRENSTRLKPPHLEPAHLERMLGDLAVDLPDLPRAARRLHQLTHGNPLFVLELVELLQADGDLELLAQSGRDPRRLPASLRGLFEVRLNALDDDERTTVEAAAVLGMSIRSRVLGEVVDLEDVPFATLLAKLEARQILLLRRDQVQFRHGVLRRYVLETLPAERRREVHRRAALYYDAEADRGGSARTPLKAATHADRAGERDILARHLANAARLLGVEGHIYKGFELVLAAERRAREDPPHPELLLESLLQHGRYAHRLGYSDEEKGAWIEAAKLATRLGRESDRARALHGLGRLNSRSGRFVVAQTQLRGALTTALLETRPELSAAAIQLDLAECLLWSGDEEQAQAVLDQAAPSIDPAVDASGAARFYKERGDLLLELDRLDEARDSYRRGRSAIRGLGLRWTYRALLIGSARVFRELCDFDKAAQAAEIVIKSARSDKDQRHQAIAASVLGETLARKGNPEQAFPHVLRAVRLSRRIGDSYLYVNSLGSLALLYRWKRFSRHSLEKAVHHARRAVALARDLTGGRLETRALAALALCYRDQGRLNWALAITRKAVDLLATGGRGHRAAAEVRQVHSLVLRALGRRSEARSHREAAQEMIRQRLSGIRSDAVRARVQRLDPLVRQILGPA